MVAGEQISQHDFVFLLLLCDQITHFALILVERVIFDLSEQFRLLVPGLLCALWRLFEGTIVVCVLGIVGKEKSVAGLKLV